MNMDSKDKKQVTKNVTIKQSLGHALVGLSHVIRRERNFRFHLVLATVVTICGFFFRLNIFEWVIILCCMAMVLIAEIFNSAIEYLADQSANGKFHPLVKQAKDVASAGVLVAASFSALIGAIIFLNKILN